MSFNDYHKALEYLQQQNVVAVRMGRMETPMEEMENCIDYAGYYADDFRDLYVTSECMFMIVNACGIFSLASFFIILPFACQALKHFLCRRGDFFLCIIYKFNALLIIFLIQSRD